MSSALCRARAVVREDWYLLCTNLSGWFLGDFSREWAESQCCLCIPGIVHSSLTNAITPQDFDLFLSPTKLPPCASTLKSPTCICKPRERKASGRWSCRIAQPRLHSHNECFRPEEERFTLFTTKHGRHAKTCSKGRASIQM